MRYVFFKWIRGYCGSFAAITVPLVDCRRTGKTQENPVTLNEESELNERMCKLACRCERGMRKIAEVQQLVHSLGRHLAATLRSVFANTKHEAKNNSIRIYGCGGDDTVCDCDESRHRFLGGRWGFSRKEKERKIENKYE
jgi:hypothetical protein